MAKILDGKLLALTIRGKIRDRVSTLPSEPGLAVLLVGNDPASHTYVDLKKVACEEAGIHFELFLYDASVGEQELIDKIHELNLRTNIHGILVQLPLPTQDAHVIIPEIDPLKDVDGFHAENLKRLREGKPCIASAVALGVMKLIRAAVGDGPLPPTATIVSSPFFAVPLETLLREQRVEVTVTQAEDPELVDKTKKADILVVAEGIPNLIRATHVKPGAIVIDVGTTKVNEVLKGDVDFDAVEPIASAITPVPGGVGPMTVAMLLVNILKAYQLQNIDT
ncbi:bifunctional methylenetetrahydrofolate dehydrogenase/methenyltetrahydrofolate cyclohydrolase [Candidatus Uhrbacteria bacterium CG_4_9_14_3_um_filter_50_9]|uniref:Bifunctional protein FolD n=1 Tax=Candidatus Uhrbacteria bacterium CG_4_9_14_3_um_filter_50_9 TaxID=1975035 RepID=A0A2M7XEW9_9BACT|nr:MAG: bifunctional methylenetetrahydrofolate dehydrogenase/methenyltetrahydrofolate cyclohydrolase [Candidatus Uhrbacteria bacterium CG_4_9_14_3_um_filter_50_9]